MDSERFDRQLSFIVEIDKEKNKNFARGEKQDISGANSKVAVCIIPTDEEYMIALDTYRLA